MAFVIFMVVVPIVVFLEDIFIAVSIILVYIVAIELCINFFQTIGQFRLPGILCW